MASVNKVILIGNLGRDPEVRYLPSGDAVANLNLATTEKWKDKNGEQQEQTEWHRVAFFGRQAEIFDLPDTTPEKLRRIFEEGQFGLHRRTPANAQMDRQGRRRAL